MTRQREPRLRNELYLRWVRRLPCVRCAWNGRFNVPSEAAHCKLAIAAHGWRGWGLSERSDDTKALPLCSRCHRTDNDAQHTSSERKFWDAMCICPACLSEALLSAYLADASGMEVIYSAVRLARTLDAPPH